MQIRSVRCIHEKSQINLIKLCFRVIRVFFSVIVSDLVLYSLNVNFNCFSPKLVGKISAQPHTIVKQICFPNGNVVFLSMFSLPKNWMHNVGWGCAEILLAGFLTNNIVRSRAKSSRIQHQILIHLSLLSKTTCRMEGALPQRLKLFPHASWFSN